MADITKLEVLEMHKKSIELIENLNKLVKNQESRIQLLHEMLNLVKDKEDLNSDAIKELCTICKDQYDMIEELSNKKKK